MDKHGHTSLLVAFYLNCLCHPFQCSLVQLAYSFLSQHTSLASICLYMLGMDACQLSLLLYIKSQSWDNANNIFYLSQTRKYFYDSMLGLKVYSYTAMSVSTAKKKWGTLWQYVSSSQTVCKCHRQQCMCIKMCFGYVRCVCVRVVSYCVCTCLSVCLCEELCCWMLDSVSVQHCAHVCSCFIKLPQEKGGKRMEEFLFLLHSYSIILDIWFSLGTFSFLFLL